jgi:hypothetical protein
MYPDVEKVGYGLLLPAAVAAGVLYLSRRFLSREVAERQGAAVGLVAGFCAAYFLFSWTVARPTFYRNWLPYVGIVAGVLGPVALASGVRLGERWAVWLTLGLLAAWFLVLEGKGPFDPARLRAGLIAAGLFLVWCVCMEALARHLPGGMFPALLCLATLCGAAVLFQSGSLKFAQLAGAIAAPLAGCALVARFHRDEALMPGAVPPLGVLLGGLMFIGYNESFSNVPTASYALIPAAPLALWVCAVGPLARWQGMRRLAVQAGVVLVPLAVALVLAFTVGEPEW